MQRDDAARIRSHAGDTGTVSQPHWVKVWGDRSADEVSWFQIEPTLSMELVRRVTDTASSVIDVGGGASTLVDHLLADGYSDISVLDLAADALAQSRERLGPDSGTVVWMVGDITTYDFGRQYDVWHDRAVLHFLTNTDDRSRYADNVRRTVAPGGHAILATFAPTGPDQCSGLPVQRYDADAMTDLLGPDLEAVDFVEETHVTPAGSEQDFLYGVFRRR